MTTETCIYCYKKFDPAKGHDCLRNVTDAERRAGKLLDQPKEQQPSVLQEAEEIVQGARRKFYGHPAENHSRTAELWAVYLGVAVSAEDVCMLNILQKISRGRHSLTRDTLVDIAGYARNVEIIQEQREAGSDQ